MAAAADPKLYVVAWKIHSGGRLGGPMRPKLTDFGRWSMLHEEGEGGKKTTCGRHIPGPHRCYEYAHSLDAFHEANAQISFENEKIKVCSRCFPDGLPS
jgi:hypothetical protein